MRQLVGVQVPLPAPFEKNDLGNDPRSFFMPMPYICVWGCLAKEGFISFTNNAHKKLFMGVAKAFDILNHCFDFF